MDDYKGYLDVFNSNKIEGWAWNVSDPNNNINIDVFLDDTFVETIKADKYREDLYIAGIGRGDHAFKYVVPRKLIDDKDHIISLCYKNTKMNLPGSPFKIKLAETVEIWGKETKIKLLAESIDDHDQVKNFITFNNLFISFSHAELIDFQTTHVANDKYYEIVYEKLKASGIKIEEYHCPSDKFISYITSNQEKYSNSNYLSVYGDYFPQKAFEHWVSAEYLNFSTQDKVLDFAAWISPASEILNNYMPAIYYKHDITLKTDLNTKTISGYSNEVECEDDYFNYIIAHCAIDNFEKDYDISFFKEAERILKPGGKVLITPLHMAERFENRIALGSPGIEPDKSACVVLGMPNTLRFGRHYNVKSLKERILSNSGLHFWVVHINNLPSDRYPVTTTNRFMLIGEKQ